MNASETWLDLSLALPRESGARLVAACEPEKSLPGFSYRSLFLILSRPGYHPRQARPTAHLLNLPHLLLSTSSYLAAVCALDRSPKDQDLSSSLNYGLQPYMGSQDQMSRPRKLGQH